MALRKTILELLFIIILFSVGKKNIYIKLVHIKNSIMKTFKSLSQSCNKENQTECG